MARKDQEINGYPFSLNKLASKKITRKQFSNIYKYMLKHVYNIRKQQSIVAF